MRVIVVGSGFVGSTAAYAILHRGFASEVWLSDTDRSRAEGEAMDLSQAVPFLKYALVQERPLDACDEADLVIVAAGRSSVPGETRLDLLKENAGRVRSICAALKRWRRLPIVVMVANPVDVLTEIAVRELGDPARVFGSGTVLDTARLKAALGARFGFDPHSIHGYVLGEHGDSEFPAWSTVAAGGAGIRSWPGFDEKEARGLFEGVRRSAYEIIKRKRATYFAIGAAAALIAEAVLRDQGTILSVSVSLGGQYGLSGLSLSLPCVLGREGVRRALEPVLDEGERGLLAASAAVIRAALASEAGAPQKNS